MSCSDDAAPIADDPLDALSDEHAAAAFRRLVAEKRVEKAPLMEVIRRQPMRIIQAALLRLIEQAPFYIYTAFIFSYGVQALSVSRNFLRTASLASTASDLV